MRRLALLLVATAPLLASCSGSDDSARPLPTVAPTSVPVAEPTTSGPPPEPTTTTAPPPAGPERCAAPAVEVRFLDSRAAAAHSLAVFEVRNTAPGPCRVAGHPAVELVDPSGRVLTTAHPGTGTIVGPSPPVPVTVGAGGTAYFGIESETVCAEDAPPADASRVRVVLPDDRAPVEVAASITVCPGARILVSPLRASQTELTGG